MLKIKELSVKSVINESGERNNVILAIGYYSGYPSRMSGIKGLPLNAL